MKHHCRRYLNIFLILAVLWLTAAGNTQAAAAPPGATKAKTSSLKNVTKAPVFKGKWVKDGDTFRFEAADGTVCANRWICVKGSVFYLDKNSKRVKGWVSYRNANYYLNTTGRLVTGWRKIRGKNYYFLKDSAKNATGLRKIDGYTYYFDPKTGACVSDWRKIRGSWYYFNEKTYRMRSNVWVHTDGKFYYAGADGKRKTSCWLTLGDKRYYLQADGSRATGTVYLNGKGRYFKINGVYDPTKHVRPLPDSKKPMVALTFDDGPGAYTSRLLKCLKNNDAAATFFLVGSSVSRYSSVVKQMSNQGCEIGSHSYSHPSFTSLSSAGRQSEVQRTSALIKDACGKNPTLFRLPYGAGSSNSAVLSDLGLPSIFWSIDTRDWANTGNPQHTIDEVLNHVKDGDIVLMHDIHYSSVVAAETIIPALIKRGYQLVTVSELAKYKGKTTLHAGKTYYNFY